MPTTPGNTPGRHPSSNPNSARRNASSILGTGVDVDENDPGTDMTPVIFHSPLNADPFFSSTTTTTTATASGGNLSSRSNNNTVNSARSTGSANAASASANINLASMSRQMSGDVVDDDIGDNENNNNGDDNNVVSETIMTTPSASDRKKNYTSSSSSNNNNNNNNNNTDDNAPLISSTEKENLPITSDTYFKLSQFLNTDPECYEQTASIPWYTKILVLFQNLTGNRQPSTLRRWIIPNEKSFDASVFPLNMVDNRRYSFYSFFIMSLFDQFRFSVYNVYFLILAISQFLPELKVGPLFTYFAPLAFVVVLSMAKDAFDDVKRWIQDRQINGSLYHKLMPNGTVEPVLSKDITVGTILKVEANKRVPADLVLLHTSESTGTCFVRTDQLDGETDWKLRYPVKATLHMETPEISRASIFVECEVPHRDIYSFQGTLLRQGKPKDGIDVNNTIWNGCTVASGSVLGLVIHTGAETRATMNVESSSVKQTLMEREMNHMGYICFVLLMMIAILLTVLQLGIVALPLGKVIVSIFRFQILLSMIIPISLRVNLDLAKLWYSIMIMRDQDAIPGVVVRNTSIAEELGRLHYLFSDKTGTLTANRMQFRNLHLEDNFSLEDTEVDDIKAALGVYFDTMADQQEQQSSTSKQNISGDLLDLNANASFTNASAASASASAAKPSSSSSALTKKSPESETTTATSSSKRNNEKFPATVKSLNFDDDVDADEDEHELLLVETNNNTNNTASASSAPRRPKTIQQQNQESAYSPHEQRSLVGYNKKQSLLIGRALLSLALCHQVTPVRDTDTGKCEFQAASPDEISMVEFAATCGIHLESRLTLRKPDAETGDILEGEMILTTEYDAMPRLEFDVLKAFPFSSERKCMGIILRNRATSEIQFFMKGADVKMIECIPKNDSTSWLEDRCGDLARMGRRTLVFGNRHLSLANYKQFARELNVANASQTNRSTAVETCMSTQLETSLTLIGLTGVEDQLQDNVVTTLEHLGACGIRVWMLTGDKIETAKCIGRSTKLIRSDLIETLVAPNMKQAVEQLNELHMAYAGGRPAVSASSVSPSSSSSSILTTNANKNNNNEDGDNFNSSNNDNGNNNNNNNIATTGNVASSPSGSEFSDSHFNSVSWALIIDGKTLEYFLGNKVEDPDPIVEKKFLQVASRADSVVVARCSPTQKAMVVSAIIKYRGPDIRAAAIGDGGNDVSMIRAAHVGFGIEGVEGKQASLAADYSIAKFCHCERLITWHGRNSYLRTCQLAQFIIHRGTVYAVIQAVFSMIFYGSTMALFNGYLVSLYSAFYTMMPTFGLVLNEDRLESDIVEFPELYRWLLKSRAFNARSLLQWLWLAFFQGGVLMYLTVKVFSDEMFQLVSVSFTGLMYTELFFVASCMNFGILWKQRRTAFFLFFAAEGFSLFCYFISVIILPDTFDRSFFFSGSFWAKTTVISVASILPVAFFKFAETRIQEYLLTRRTHRRRLFSQIF